MRTSLVYLWLVSVLHHSLIQSSPQPMAAPYLVKITSSGFLPFDADILPYSVIQRVQAEQMRQARQTQWSNDPIRTKVRATIRGSAVSGMEFLHQQQLPAEHMAQPYASASNLNHVVSGFGYGEYHNPQQQPHLERVSGGEAFGDRQYRLYDTDGDFLLNLNYHDNSPMATESRSGRKFIPIEMPHQSLPSMTAESPCGGHHHQPDYYHSTSYRQMTPSRADEPRPYVNHQQKFVTNDPSKIVQHIWLQIRR